MKTQEVNFDDIKWMYEGYNRPMPEEARVIEYCMKCHKAYEWLDYPTTEDEDTDEDNEVILYNGEEIDEFQNWLIKEKHWVYVWNAHLFYCSICYIKDLEDKLQKERNKCIIL